MKAGKITTPKNIEHKLDFDTNAAKKSVMEKPPLHWQTFNFLLENAFDQRGEKFQVSLQLQTLNSTSFSSVSMCIFCHSFRRKCKLQVQVDDKLKIIHNLLILTLQGT